MRPITLTRLSRAALRVACAGLALLALAVLGLALGLTQLVRRSLRDTLTWEGNRLLRAGQRLDEAGQKIEAAVRILVKEGGYE